MALLGVNSVAELDETYVRNETRDRPRFSERAAWKNVVCP
jgi:hypothetical protein